MSLMTTQNRLQKENYYDVTSERERERGGGV